jgi:hypothetical protein
LPGTVITVLPGQNPNIVGPHNDSSDFFGLGFALVGIVVAIVVVRLAFRSRVHPSRLPEQRRHDAPDTAEGRGGPPDEPPPSQ